MNKLFLFLLILTLLTSCSIGSRIENGDLEEVTFYDPSYHQTLKFRGDIVRHKIYSGYPLSKWTTELLFEELPYTYDKETKTGTINGRRFSIWISEKSDSKYFLTYMGRSYMLEKQWSEKNSSNLPILFIIFGTIGLTYFLYKKYGSNKMIKG